jgi:hypothetical protein
VSAKLTPTSEMIYSVRLLKLSGYKILFGFVEQYGANDSLNFVSKAVIGEKL